MTQVKICGITRAEDAALAAELGAAALGYNFYSASPRYIEPVAARRIVAPLPPFVVAVGVFANEEDAGKVAVIAREARMTAIQLHGPRFPEPVKELEGFPLIRAVPAAKGFNPQCLQRFDSAALLLDAHDDQRIGGTGQTIDWQAARRFASLGRAIILAGGLTPENVAEAIRVVRPYAVDVATGVESSPGVKDPGKMKAFFAAVKEADEREEADES